MIPLYLKLRGFKGIKAGLGLDEISLDLESLPAGIIAVCGENGRGKTTVLDNMHPYRLMPYKLRKSPEWSPAAFSFYDHTFGPDAMKELVFEMGGVRYKSVVLIDADRKKQEPYLYRQVPGASEQATWHPLNDGKSKTYDEAIEQVCGSPTLFFSSVFRAQGAKNLSDYTRGSIMSILSELLNIDHIREQGDKCNKVVNELRSQADLVRASVRSAQADVDAAAGLDQKVEALEAEVVALKRSEAVCESERDAAQTTVSRCQMEQASRESDRARLVQLRSQLADENSRHAKETSRIAADRTQLVRDRAGHESTAERKRADLLQRIERGRKIVSGAVQIRDAVAREALVAADMETATREREETELCHAELQKLAGDAARRLAVAESSAKAAQANVAKLAGIDCLGDGTGWVNSKCRFVSSAAADRDAVPGLLAELEAAEAACTEASSKVADIAGTMIAIRNRCTALGAERLELLKFTKLLPELETAEANIAVMEADLATLQQDLAGLLAGIDERLSVLDAAESAERALHNGTVEKLQADILTVPVYNESSDELKQASEAVVRAAGRLESIRAGIRSCELEIAGHRANLAAVAEKRKLVLSAEDDIMRYNSRISDFALLGKACGNVGGIISLEIDDAGPSIAALANDLLSSCYGSRFSVRLDTQAEKADGSSKEVLDILVYDNELDSTRSLSEMSGGQNAWINDAITRAICLFNIGRSGKEYGTLFADEVDGAMDPGRKMEFFGVKREALKIGRHSREFFISQTPELIEMADARIVLEPGRVCIEGV